MNTIPSFSQKDNNLTQEVYRETDYNSDKSIKIVVSDVPENNYMISNSFNVVTVQNSNYQRTKQQFLEIDNTNSDEDEDEWGAIRPTRYAWQLSLEFLQQIFEQIIFDFPLGFASLESDGGVELIWKNHSTKNEVRVSIPSHEGTDISLYIRNLGNGESKLFASSSVNQVVRALQFLYQ